MGAVQAKRLRTMDENLRRVLISIAIMVAFAAIFHYIYKTNIAPLFEYSGLTYRDPDPFSYAGMVLLTGLVAAVLAPRIVRVSDFILWVIFIFGVAPAMLLAQYSRTLSISDANALGLNLAGCMVMVRLLTKGKVPRLLPRKMRMDAGAFFALVICLSLLFYAYMIAFAGIQLRFLSFSDVYDVREGFGRSTSSVPFLGYLLPLQSNVLNPLLIARGVYARRRWALGLGVLGQVVIYTSTGEKSVLFSIGVMIGIAMLFRVWRRPRSLLLLVATTATSLSGFLLDRATDSTLWSSLFFRRVLVIPGALTAAYVALFDDRPKMLFREVVGIGESPYTLRPVNIVGGEFVGNYETAANVNLFGHGFLQAGFLGMYIEALVLVLLLWLADDATRGLPTAVACIIFVTPAESLSNASVFTTIATHGYAAAVVLSALAPTVGWGLKRRRRRQSALVVTRRGRVPLRSVTRSSMRS